MAWRKRWKLYRIRPKLHLGFHIVRMLRVGGGNDAAINPCCALDAPVGCEQRAVQAKVGDVGMMRTTLEE